MNAIQIATNVDGARRVVAAMQTPREFVGASQAPSVPERKLPLRVDDLRSYQDFDAQRAAASPSLPALAASVAQLRDLLRAHTSDGHGVDVSDVFDVAGDVSELRDAVVRGEIVPASLEPWARKCVRFWRDGDVLCCTVRVKWKAGPGRLLTMCSPVADHVQDVLGDAALAGVDPIEGLAYLPHVAVMKGSGQLLRRVCRAALRDPRLRTCAVPCTAMVDSDGKVSWT